MNPLGDYGAVGHASPDGLGEYLERVGQTEVPPQPITERPLAPERYRVSQPEPISLPLRESAPAPAAPTTGDRLSAGSGLLAALLGAGIGAVVGGGWGAAAGLFLVGGVRNSVRAARHWGATDPEQRVETRKSVAVAVVGLGASGYFAYRAFQAKKEG